MRRVGNGEYSAYRLGLSKADKRQGKLKPPVSTA